MRGCSWYPLAAGSDIQHRSVLQLSLVVMPICAPTNV